MKGFVHTSSKRRREGWNATDAIEMFLQLVGNGEGKKRVLGGGG